MKTIGQQMLLLVFLLNCGFFTACQAQTNAEPTFKKLSEIKTETPNGAFLTITKVKAPIYAVRSLIVSGFKQSIPEYQALKGLTFKAYLLTDDAGFFGGIYVWQSEIDAKNQFNEAWFEKVEKKYGVKGNVEYYRIIAIKCMAETTKSEGEFWSVLSRSKNEFEINENAAGLLKTVEIKDENNQKGFVTLWATKADAQKYFEKSSTANTFFDTPILLDNSTK